MDTETTPKSETIRRIEAALDKLPARRRDIFLLHRCAGLSYRQIAACYGISEKRVERHIAKAMLHIAGELDGLRQPWWRRWLDRWW